MSSFNELKKQLTASDVETIMTDMGYDWENDYDDYEEFINAIDEYLNQNKDEKDPKNKDGKDPNAIYDWGSFPLEKNFEWKNQNKDE